MVKLTCYLPAEKPIFVVINIDRLDYVAELHGAVYEKLTLYDFDGKLTDIRLYKTNVSRKPKDDLKMRALKWIHGLQLEDPQLAAVGRNDALDEVFPYDTYSDGMRDSIDIMVVNAEVLELYETLGDSENRYKQMVKKALEKRMDSWNSMPSPSDVVHHPEKMAEVLSGDDPIIHMGRPGGIPAVIFNSELARLQQTLEKLEQFEVTPNDVNLARNYIKLAVALYPNEDFRRKAIQELVDTIIGKEANWEKTHESDNKRFRPEGSWWDIEKRCCPLMWGFKNTLGLEGDALIQAAVNYAKVIASDECKWLWEHSNFPIILIAATANRLEIAVAVSIGQIYVTRLLVLDLSFGFCASENIIRLARVFKAVRCAFENLDAYYENLANTLPQKLSCLYPKPSSADGRPLPKLTYHKFLARNGQPTSALVDLGKVNAAMYIATLETEVEGKVVEKKAIVKFTGRYNAEAHYLLAEARLAPKLYHCSRVVGSLFMVVMEHVNGMSVWQLQKDKQPIPAIVGSQVEEAVRIIHNAGIVFGDLREPNILYVPPGDSSEERVVLVDFDWPGEDGKSRYPATLNTDNLWAEEVRAYAIMRKEHDMWQVERLQTLINVTSSA